MHGFYNRLLTVDLPAGTFVIEQVAEIPLGSGGKFQQLVSLVQSAAKG